MKSALPLLGDRYRLGPVIGTGGMGAVHRAYDERFGRELAVKVVRAGADAVERERLRREAQFLAGLNHPNLVAVYDAGADTLRSGETVWFAMELVHGPDLKQVIKDRERLSPADVARVLRGATGALHVLHEAGVVHRDLKPANVLLTTTPDRPSWDVKLADLGIARLMLDDHLTETGQVVGTAAYLSPEQVAGRTVGPASDVYALGLLAVEALTGRVAFPGSMVESATARLVRSPDVPSGAGPEWARLLADMTAREPEDRPTAQAVRERLALLPVPAEPITDPEATAVLPASALRPGARVEDLPTEAMPVHPTRVLHDDRTEVVPDWSPSLRRGPVLRGRRKLLAVGAIAVAVGLAGGGAAVIGGSSGADAVSAQPVVAASRAPAPSTTPTATPKPSTPAPRATPSATPTPVASKAVQAAADRSGSGQQADRGRDHVRGDAEKRARKAAERLRKRLERGLHLPIPIPRFP